MRDLTEMHDWQIVDVCYMRNWLFLKCNLTGRSGVIKDVAYKTLDDMDLASEENPIPCDDISQIEVVDPAENPGYRERTLQAENPTVELIWKAKGTMRDEAALHEMFKEKRVRGEWFLLSEDDIETVKEGYYR